jgi:hypothetical protein
VLYVGRHAKTASVHSYDLDGRPLEEHLSFRDAARGGSSLNGLDLDGDRRIWVADGAAAKLRAFTLFGRQILELGDEAEERADRVGGLGRPVDLLCSGSMEDFCVTVASSGTRRHAVQEHHLEQGRSRSLRPMGEPEGRFRQVVRLARFERELFVVEARARRVQVFRDGEFHYAFRIPDPQGGWVEPAAVAPLDDGRLVLAVRGDTSGLLLVDRAGKLLQVLADGGSRPGDVFEPSDVVVEQGSADHRRRCAVIDWEGDRVQVFNLEGRCYGSIAGLPRS